jgi:hypothetical protein
MKLSAGCGASDKNTWKCSATLNHRRGTMDTEVPDFGILCVHRTSAVQVWIAWLS